AGREPLEARRRLVEKYQIVVAEFASGDAQRDDRMDYLGAGNEGLLRAINKCTPGRSLKTLAVECIKNAIEDYRDSNETGAVRRKSKNGYRYRRDILLPEEHNIFSDPLSSNYRREVDWSFDYTYESDDEEADEGEDFHERHGGGSTFDRRGH